MHWTFNAKKPFLEKKATGLRTLSSLHDGRIILTNHPSIAPIAPVNTPLDLNEKPLLTRAMASSSSKYDLISISPTFEGMIQLVITSYIMVLV